MFCSKKRRLKGIKSWSCSTKMVVMEKELEAAFPQACTVTGQEAIATSWGRCLCMQGAFSVGDQSNIGMGCSGSGRVAHTRSIQDTA